MHAGLYQHEVRAGVYHEVRAGVYHEVRAGVYHEVRVGVYHEVHAGEVRTHVCSVEVLESSLRWVAVSRPLLWKCLCAMATMKM